MRRIIERSTEPRPINWITPWRLGDGSAIEAGTGVGVSVDALGYSFGTRVKLVRLTPEPKSISFGIAARKGKLSPATEKFCQCAREAFGAIR